MEVAWLWTDGNCTLAKVILTKWKNPEEASLNIWWLIESQEAALVLFVGLSSISGHMESDKDLCCTSHGRVLPTATVQNLWVGKGDYVILESAWKPEPHEMELLRKSKEFAFKRAWDFVTLVDRA